MHDILLPTVQVTKWLLYNIVRYGTYALFNSHIIPIPLLFLCWVRLMSL